MGINSQREGVRMSERVSIRKSANQMGLDATEMVLIKGHLFAPSESGKHLYRWDPNASRWVRGKFEIKPSTINDSKRRTIRYSGQLGREL